MAASPLILVADGDATYRAQVAELVARIGSRVLEAVDGREALELANRERPELVLLDVNLVGLNGYAVCRELREVFGDDISIIFVSGHRTEAYDRVAGLLVGANDYVVKPFDEGELLARIRSSLRRRDAAPRTRHRSTTIAVLTAREREVLNLLARGLTQLDIAGKLVISPKTVGTHIQRILSKLGVHSRAQAVVLAHREGLTEAVGGSFVDVEGHVLTARLDAP